MRTMRVLLVLCALCGVSLCAVGDVHPDIVKAGRRGGPGVAGRLTETGLAYVREIVMRLLNREIPKLKFKPITANMVEGSGKINIENMKIVEYWAPDEYYLDLEPTKRFTWTLIGLSVRTTGDFYGNVKANLLPVPINATGTFESLVNDLAFEMTVELDRTSKGYPKLKVNKCTTYIREVDLAVNSGALVTIGVAIFKRNIAGQVKPMINRELCKRVRTMVEKDGNEMLESLPLKVPLDRSTVDPRNLFTRSGTGRRGRRDATAHERAKRQDIWDFIDYDTNPAPEKPKPKPKELTYTSKEIEGAKLDELRGQLRSKDFVLDLRLVQDPYVAKDAIGMRNYGEISWKGEGKTPFYPPRFTEAKTRGREMAQLFVSDYALNSLFYHAHQRGKLKIRISGADNPDVGKMLRTSCAGAKFCLGDVLQSLQSNYPNHNIDLQVVPTQSPAVFFDDDGALIGLRGNVFMYARRGSSRRRALLGVLAMEMRARLKLRFRSADTIVGSAVVNHFSLKQKAIKSAHTFEETELFDLQYFSKDVMGEQFTAALQKGFPVPKIAGTSIVEPKMRFMKNVMAVDTYFTIDEKFLSELVDGILRKKGLRD